MELAYPRRKFDIVVTDLERPLNNRLLKILLMPEDDQVEVWRNEVSEIIEELEILRLKPTRQPAPEMCYYTILYDEPYGDDRRNVHTEIERLQPRHNFIFKDNASAIQKRMEIFHRRLAKGLSKGEAGLADKLLTSL